MDSLWIRGYDRIGTFQPQLPLRCKPMVCVCISKYIMYNHDISKYIMWLSKMSYIYNIYTSMYLQYIYVYIYIYIYLCHYNSVHYVFLNHLLKHMENRVFDISFQAFWGRPLGSTIREEITSCRGIPWPVKWGSFRKWWVKSPQIIHGLIGISIIFIIHFNRDTPYFLKHPNKYNHLKKLAFWGAFNM